MRPKSNQRVRFGITPGHRENIQTNRRDFKQHRQSKLPAPNPTWITDLLAKSVDIQQQEGSAFAMGIDPDSLSDVAYTHHALRDPRMKSRTSFGNTARKVLNQEVQVYEERLFQTSHGGIGGAPAPQAIGQIAAWGQKTNYYHWSSDPTCTPEQGEKRVRVCNNNSAAAQAWIIERARSHGIPIG